MDGEAFAGRPCQCKIVKDEFDGAVIQISGGPQTGATSSREIELENENATLRKGIQAVEDLISESRGVYGLHLNGDPSPWGELRSGGNFEEWLIEFDIALDVVGETKS